MKKISYMLCLLVFLAACKDKTKFTIQGKIENFGAEKKVFLYGMSSETMTVLDSTVLSEKGEFKFTNTSEQPNFYRVNIADAEYMTVAKNGDKLNLTADLNDKKRNYEIKGSDDSEKLTEFNKLRSEHTEKVEVIKEDFEKKVSAHPENREALVKQLSPTYMQSLSDLNQAIIKFALANTNSLVSFYAISLINPSGNESAMLTYAEKVSADLKKNAAVDKFVNKVIRLKALQVGQPAPDFSIPSINGNTIKLADFKGKYTLIDFWASWCGPCRSENPSVVKAYNTYKDRNFTILGISLDKDKNAWSQAIKQDGLTWSHASELADFQGEVVKLYQVEAIPASFLLDPQGKIIARDLRGEELDAFLNKTLR